MLSCRKREFVFSTSICFAAALTTSGWQCPTKMWDIKEQSTVLRAWEERGILTGKKRGLGSVLPSFYWSFSLSGPLSRGAAVELGSRPFLRCPAHRMLTVSHVVDTVQVPPAFLIKHVLPLGAQDFDGVRSKENLAWGPRHRQSRYLGLVRQGSIFPSQWRSTISGKLQFHKEKGKQPWGPHYFFIFILAWNPSS